MHLVIKLPVLLLLGLAVQVATGDDEMTCRTPDGVRPCNRSSGGCSPVSCSTSAEALPQFVGCPIDNRCPDYNGSNVDEELNITAQPTTNKFYFSVNVSWEHLNLPALGEWRYELKLYEDKDSIVQGAVRCVCSSSQSSDTWKTWDTITAYYTTVPPTTQRNLLLLIYDNETLRYAINGTFENPSSCTDFRPLNPQQCTPPYYTKVRNLTYDTSVVKVNQRQVSLSWKAPQQNDNYQLLLVYFITVTKLEEEATSYHFNVTNTTNIIIGPLDNNATYSCLIQTQVPCALRCGQKTQLFVTTHNEPLPGQPSTSTISLFPSPTPLPSSSTPLPSSSTPLPSSSTPLPSSSTPLPSSSTPLPSSSTPLPSSSTPLPSSSTPLPSSSTLTESDSGNLQAAVSWVSLVVIAVVVFLMMVAAWLLLRRRQRKNKVKPKLIVPSLTATSGDTKFTNIEQAPFISQTPSDISTSSADSSEERQNVVVIYSPRTEENDTKVILEYLVNILGSGEYGLINSTFYQHERTSVRKNAAAWLDSKLSQKCTMLVVCNEHFLSDWNTGDGVDEISDELSLIFTLKQIITGRICYNRHLNVGVILLNSKDHIYVPTYLQGSRKFVVCDVDAIARFINNESKYTSSN